MTFLELCQKLVRRAGISGAITSVVGQTGEALRVVDWVAEGYRFILNLHTDWEFLRADVTFNVNTVNAVYTAAAAGVTEFGEWRFVDNDWRCYLASSGAADEQPLCYVPYDAFKRTYRYGPQRFTKGRPQVVTVRPDESLQFWPMPDAVYTIVGEQFRVPVDLSANGDTPVFKAKFHDAVLYRALMLCAEYEENASGFASAQAECDRLVSKMEEDYLPDWTGAEPMA